MTRKTTLIIYILVLIILIVTSVKALTEDCYIMEGAAVGIVGFASILTSLIPFFISRSLFKKYEVNPDKKKFKIWGLIIYFFCFPVKLAVIYLNIEMVKEGCRWAFG